jgi:hypothetical protein
MADDDPATCISARVWGMESVFITAFFVLDYSKLVGLLHTSCVRVNLRL